MLQGTASNVGKSVLVAGLCRLFRQEGVRVAPFKAQNMALNSFATADGREIGRAQAAQAEAAGIPPMVEMNPILLKPEGHARSQVVVAGRAQGTMDAQEYHRRTGELWSTVLSSLNRLRELFDLVIIEGAGSPAEVNLRASDIVNMRVAQAANAPVLLVADIDRGGVFAALVGTMELLGSAERHLVAGFVINKFRGDPALFDPGVAFLEERLQRPVLGIVPWIDAIGIAGEDSLALPSSTREILGSGRGPGGYGGAVEARSWVLDIVVIRVPHIANFDDFDPLTSRPGVRVRYVDSAEGFGRPDLVILPGTKTTRADLEFLRQRGVDQMVGAHARGGGATLGICGGYQMLGERIEDPDGVEGPPGITPGLGLLPVVTHYAREKTTRQVRGHVLASSGLLASAHGSAFSAYEIHMGRTERSGSPLFSLDDRGGSGELEGSSSPEGRIVGTCLHGLFENAQLVDALLGALAGGKSVSAPPAPPRDDPYDRLAAVLRRSLDMDRLRTLAGIR